MEERMSFQARLDYFLYCSITGRKQCQGTIALRDDDK